MKNILLTFLAVVTLASCSAPKYAYYFDTHDYEAGKRKKQAAVEASRVTTAEIMQTVQAVKPAADEPVAVASTGGKIYATPAEVKATDNMSPTTVSKKFKRNLAKQIKAAIKDYKKQKHDDSLAEGGDKNQLVALLLAIFLGALGIHRFYIGRTGTALLQLLLFVLGLFLLFPLYALAIWILVDIILIVTGNLTPKNGSYNPKL
jgi:TM2 domain-containing membrane protein YozV